MASTNPQASRYREGCSRGRRCEVGGGVVRFTPTSQLRTYRCNALTDAICQQETHAPHQIASQAASCYVSSRYGFLRKLDRNLSANQNTKIAANDTQKYIPVHKRAFPAVVIALSLGSKKDGLNWDHCRQWQDGCCDKSIWSRFRGFRPARCGIRQIVSDQGTSSFQV